MESMQNLEPFFYITRISYVLYFVLFIYNIVMNWLVFIANKTVKKEKRKRFLLIFLQSVSDEK
jgi:hypothetical protein